MSDLADKFTGLEEQLSAQHSEIGAQLDEILLTLGDPQTTTLADLATKLTAINNNLIGMAIANGTFHSQLLTAVNLMSARTYNVQNALGILNIHFSTQQEYIELINTTTETMLQNNSINAQRILAAICPCATSAPLLPTPLDVTPTSLADAAKCRRIQFYLSLFSNWLTKIANYGGAVGIVTGDAIGTLLGLAAAASGLAATLAEVGSVLGPPGAVIGAVLGLIGGAIGLYGASILSDYATAFQAPALQSALLTALFDASNADEGYTAFKSTVIAHMNPAAAEVIYTLWWSAWSNDIYSGVPEVDDSAFDGTLCSSSFAFVECVTLDSQSISMAARVGSKASAAMILPPAGLLSASSIIFGSYRPYVFLSPAVFVMDAFEYRFTRLSGGPAIVSGVAADGSPTYFNLPLSTIGTVYTVHTHTTKLIVHSGLDNGSSSAAFSVEICPPV